MDLTGGVPVTRARDNLRAVRTEGGAPDHSTAGQRRSEGLSQVRALMQRARIG
jgi:hypothetical protein